jgi:hypothetical protein
MNHKQNPMCDGSHCIAKGGKVRMLPLTAISNLLLCYSCYRYEIKYRKKCLAEGMPYDLPGWKDLKIYTGK